MRKRSIIPIVYILFLLLPIYWLVAMSFKTTNEILPGSAYFRKPSRLRTTSRYLPIRRGTGAISTRSFMCR
jgi:ABC-type glycerol-3-phosphate transport system permease component